MPGFETRFERLELKYLIDEGTAARVRRALEPWCRPDAHNLGPASRRPAWTGAGPGYQIRSLYLDTPSLAFHRAKGRGDPERFKLRIRGYSGSEGPVLELKRRSADVVEKTRAAIEPGSLRAAAHGGAKLAEETPEARAFVERYARLVLTTGAEPTLLVSYDREAFTSEVDDYARITFDRNLAFQRTRRWQLDGEAAAWGELESHAAAAVPRPLVLLELKCVLSVPHWITDLIRSHDLRRDSVSKYSLGIYVTRRLEGASELQKRARGILR